MPGQCFRLVLWLLLCQVSSVPQVLCTEPVGSVRQRTRLLLLRLVVIVDHQGWIQNDRSSWVSTPKGSAVASIVAVGVPVVWLALSHLGVTLPSKVKLVGRGWRAVFKPIVVPQSHVVLLSLLRSCAHKGIGINEWQGVPRLAPAYLLVPLGSRHIH